MALAPGSRIGPYQVAAQIGSGGMGEVYRARDGKLQRDVAVKVVPEAFAHDRDRLWRFEGEARTLASLNHPNIAAIYGVEDAGGMHALVLELVEGPTLADRIAQGAVPVDQVLPIARQIANALEAAHERGIVHRDLKPANIKLRPDGVVKVLDFGLAKLVEPTRVAPASDDGVTRSAVTREGVILGTAAYMSPEQARGLAVDERTDIWAFGCVLYELLTGTLAFGGVTAHDRMASVLSREPDWTRVPAQTPPEVKRLLRRCLQKDQGQRLRDIGDVRLLIDDALSAAATGVGSGEPKRAGAGRVRWLGAAAAATVSLVVAGLAIYQRPAASPPGETLRLSISAPGTVTPQLSAAVSPDGRLVAFVATDARGRAMLWVRALDQLEPRELPGTERAAHPFWSPDSRSLGFIADGKLKRVELDGSTVQALTEVGARIGPAWGPDGTILFNSQPNLLDAIPATGGPKTTILTADPADQLAMAWPRFLPDGRHFIYFARSRRPERTGIYAGSVDSKDTKFLLRSDFRAWYAPPGYLVFPRDETLVAQPFDAARLELTGEPTPIAQGVWFARGAAQASFSVSENGTLAYVNSSLWNAELTWFDRNGKSLGSVAPPDRYTQSPQLSPDGRRVAIGRGEFGREDDWVLDASSGTASRLTFSPQGDGTPVWSRDGRRVLFQTGARATVRDVVTGAEEVVLDSVEGRVIDWSSDGRRIVLQRFGSSLDLWIQPLDGDRRAQVFLQTPFNKAQAQLSPNGKWIAYTSNETGKDEVYVESFPMPGRKRQVSTDGGAMPRWRRDGTELFYLAGNQSMTVVTVVDQNALALGAPTPLFRTRLVVQGSESTGLATAYDVAPDGQRFLLRHPPADPGPPITVVRNWLAALGR